MSSNDMSHDDAADLGGLLEAMATDHQPVPTQLDWPPTPGSPFDAALAVFHAAATGDDPTHDTELAELHQQREDQSRAAANDAIGDDSP